MKVVQCHTLWRYGVLCLVALCAVDNVASAVNCGRIPPGLNRLRRGVDITKLDLLPLDLTAADGYRRPVIDYTCDQGQKWTNPNNGIEYDKPDQVWDIASVPSGWLNTHVRIYKTTSDVKRSMSVDAGAELLSGMFSASASYRRMQHIITNSSKYIEEVTAYSSAARADFAPFWEIALSRYAQSHIQSRLPARYEDNPARFAEFIRYFGTHYFLHGKFGGLIRMNMATDQSYYQGKTDRQVTAQAQGTFMKLIKAKGGYSGSTQTVDSTFTSKTDSTIRYYGGQTNLLASGSLSAWQPTVAGNPWIFGGELGPISDLVSDQRKKAALTRGIEVHLGLAALHDLLRTINSAIATMGSSSQIQSIKTDIQAAIAQGYPRANAVRALFNRVEEQAVVPNWFSSTIQLCYRWHPDGDGGQCGGGAGRLLCAKPGEWTQYYRDDTDRRGGGCQMSWGITAPSSTPSWFRAVQLCYRWYPDGDAGQCGGSLRQREVCANVGSYTPYYRDDSDRRGGGCRMSWRLKVATSSPAWLLNARLCYQWYPDGDGGQCGGGAARLLCAKANQWTNYYRDDTDRRGGGCRMRWGIHM